METPATKLNLGVLKKQSTLDIGMNRVSPTANNAAAKFLAGEGTYRYPAAKNRKTEVEGITSQDARKKASNGEYLSKHLDVNAIDILMNGG